MSRNQFDYENRAGWYALAIAICTGESPAEILAELGILTEREGNRK